MADGYILSYSFRTLNRINDCMIAIEFGTKNAIIKIHVKNYWICSYIYLVFVDEPVIVL